MNEATMTEYSTRTIEGRTVYRIGDAEYHDATMFWHVLIRTKEARGETVPRAMYDAFLGAFTQDARTRRRDEIERSELNGM